MIRSVQPVVGTLEHVISQQLAQLFAGNEGNSLGDKIGRHRASTSKAGTERYV
jgi:hypothetical protein